MVPMFVDCADVTFSAPGPASGAISAPSGLEIVSTAAGYVGVAFTASVLAPQMLKIEPLQWSQF